MSRHVTIVARFVVCGLISARLGERVRAGRLTSREDVVDGLARAPAALIGLREGRTFGEIPVRPGPAPPPRAGQP